MTMSPPSVVLASKSEARARLLKRVGVDFDTVASKVDEDTVKDAMLAEGAKPFEIAETLAELKALRPSVQIPGALVIGADQVLVADGKIFSKPETQADARAQLLSLRGKPHELISAVVIAKDGKAIWRDISRAKLQMRLFSDEFVDWYLNEMGDRVFSTVGCYEIEGLGATLFSRVEGDPYVIQGLPLLPVLDFLRTHKVLPA